MKKKAVALMMMFVMAASLVFVLGPAEVSAASGSYKLPTGIKTYKYENKKWKKTNDRKFKYDSKGNMTNWDGTVLKLKYNGNKLKKVTIKVNANTPDQCITTKTYDSKGRVTKIVYDYTEFRKITAHYKYDKKGYVKSRTYNGLDEDANEVKCTDYYKTEYYKNGMPKKITRTSNYDNEKKIEYYNDKGFCTSCKKYEGKKLVTSYTVEYKMSGGKILSAVENYKIRNGKKTNYKWKYVYSYSKAKTKDKKAHAAIIGLTQDTFIFQTIGNNSSAGWCW